MEAFLSTRGQSFRLDRGPHPAPPIVPAAGRRRAMDGTGRLKKSA